MPAAKCRRREPRAQRRASPSPFSLLGARGFVCGQGLLNPLRGVAIVKLRSGMRWAILGKSVPIRCAPGSGAFVGIRVAGRDAAGTSPEDPRPNPQCLRVNWVLSPHDRATVEVATLNGSAAAYVLLGLAAVACFAGADRGTSPGTRYGPRHHCEHPEHSSCSWPARRRRLDVAGRRRSATWPG